PTALAAQVATIDDRDVKEGWENLAALQALLVALHRQDALEAHVPGQLPQQPLVGFHQQALGHLQVHAQSSLSISRRGAEDAKKTIPIPLRSPRLCAKCFLPTNRNSLEVGALPLVSHVVGQNLRVRLDAPGGARLAVNRRPPILMARQALLAHPR